jgi:hypothetical protein
MGRTQQLGNYVNAIFQDSSNNIGIGGSANASFKLQVTGATNLTGALTASTATFESSGSGNTFLINHTSGSGIALTITKGGNGEGLIINKTSGTGNALSVTGTTSLGGALSGTSATFSGNVRINAASSGTNKLIFGIAATDYYWLEYNDATGNIGYFSKYNQIFYGGAAGTTPLMTILNGGNVGIGTSSPQRKFVIADSSGNGLEISNSSGYSTLLAYNRTTSAYQNIVLGEGSGNVLIGTTTDNGRKLNVNGSGLFSGTLSTQKIEMGSIGGGVNITTNSTFTLISSDNFAFRSNMIVSVSIYWNNNANAQRQYLLFLGATDTGWGNPNSALSVVSSNDWSSGYVGAATFTIGGSGQLRTLNIAVSNAATYNVTAYASILVM